MPLIDCPLLIILSARSLARWVRGLNLSLAMGLTSSNIIPARRGTTQTPQTSGPNWVSFSLHLTFFFRVSTWEHWNFWMSFCRCRRRAKFCGTAVNRDGKSETARARPKSRELCLLVLLSLRTGSVLGFVVVLQGWLVLAMLPQISQNLN